MRYIKLLTAIIFLMILSIGSSYAVTGCPSGFDETKEIISHIKEIHYDPHYDIHNHYPLGVPVGLLILSDYPDNIMLINDLNIMMNMLIQATLSDRLVKVHCNDGKVTRVSII